MEQPIETKNVTPVDAAGSDPASVPGLVPARQNPDPAKPDAEPSVALTKEAADEEAADEGAVDRDAVDEEAVDEGAEAPVAADGPAFTASDRRGSITADHTGVRLRLDDQEAEFRWDEIGAVEVGTSRRRLTVTVHTPDSRWYPNDVEAPNKTRAEEWADELDKVLDAYFED